VLELLDLLRDDVNQMVNLLQLRRDELKQLLKVYELLLLKELHLLELLRHAL
jgi:hypothetical protein